jgi:non-ribosomal peptide synthetase component F
VAGNLRAGLTGRPVLVAPGERHCAARWMALQGRAPALRFLAIDDLPSSEPADGPLAATPEEVALLQYPSRSTSRPKGGRYHPGRPFGQSRHDPGRLRPGRR